MNINEISDLRLKDMNNMSDYELEVAVRTIGAYVNRSYNKIKESAFKRSNVTDQLDASGGKIHSVYGPNQTKSREDLKREIMRAQVYVRCSGSTLTKLRAQKKTVEKRLGQKFKNDAQYVKFWDVYNKVEEILVTEFDSTQIQGEVASMLKDGSSIDDIIQFYESAYIKRESERLEYDTADAIQGEPYISGELNNI